MTRGYILILINPLQELSKQGLVLTLVDNKLKVTPANRVIQEIAGFIKQHKESIKNQLLAASQHVGKLSQLTLQQKNWLEQIADYLQTTPSFLLEHQLIDQYDLMELLDKETALVARCIKTNPYWTQ